MPGAPTSVVATALNHSASVTFLAPASNGGSAIMGYTVTSSGGGTDSNAGSTSLTHTVTGLTNGTSYTFTVKATNSVGEGSASSVSNSITPADTTSPTVNTFTIPSTSTSLIVSISSLTATDNNAVTGYLLTESSLAPLASDSGWSGTVPTTYTFASQGSKTLYAWAKDATGNVSTSMSASITITLNATTFTFTGPTSGNVNSASTNFTVTPNNSYTGTITITPSGTGSTGLSSTVLTFLGSTPQTFTITPTNSGSITLTPTNSGGLTNPSNIVYTANAVVPGDASPLITSISVTPSSTSSFIIWKTDDLSSSKVNYGLTNSYGLSTTELDTLPRVINHMVLIPNLASCTVYHYSIYSGNGSSLHTQTDDAIFSTTGCTGSSTVKAQSTDEINFSSGGIINLVADDHTVKLVVPINFSNKDANFQIKKLNESDTVQSTSVPLGYVNISSYVYDIKALDQDSNVITIFDHPLTVSMTYNASDIVGKNESSLKIYRWDGINWNVLSNCTTDTNTKTVTCETDHFSVFSLFGQEVVFSHNTNIVYSGGVGGSKYYSPVVNTSSVILQHPISNIASVPSSTVSAIQKVKKYLELSMNNKDVKTLQLFLISQNKGQYAKKLSVNGATNYFGKLTQQALSEWQKANKIYPATGSFGPKTITKIKLLNL